MANLPVAAVYDCRVQNALALTEALQNGSHRQPLQPSEMILLSMIFSKESLLKSKPVRESQKGNCPADSNISKI
jgi:hypothetical protein